MGDSKDLRIFSIASLPIMSQVQLSSVIATSSSMGTSAAKVGFLGVSQVVIDVLVAVSMAPVSSIDAM